MTDPRHELEHLYAEHAERLYAFLAYRTGEPAVAEDLLADVFERALRSWRRFDPRRGRAQTWLFAIAVNRLRDHDRRERARRRAYERARPDDVRDDADDALGERDALMHALEVLSAEERETVALRFGADLTVPQIAALVDVPLTTIEGRLYRALRRLRAELEPVGDRAAISRPAS